MVQEAARISVERFCCGKKIVQADTLEQGGGNRDGLFDDLVITAESPENLSAALVGRTIQHCHRKGKNLWYASK